MASDAYQDSGHKDHKATVEKANNLAKQIFGEGPASEDGAEGGGVVLYPSIPRPPLPPGVEWPEGLDTFIRQQGHAVGMLDKQVEKFMNGIAKEVSAQHQKEEASKKTGFAELRSRWGEKFEQRLAFAQNAVKQFDPALAEFLDKSGLGNNPALAEVFYTLGESMKNQGLIVADVDGIQGEPEIRAELDRLRRSNPYFNSAHANHAAVVAAVNKLMQKLHKEG